MTEALPPPPVPAEVDLRDFPFMPLDVARLRDSDLAALESRETCWTAVLLWSAAWHQVPAGSLPDDDRILAKLAGFGDQVKPWLKMRSGALRGFTKCSDGRLYHAQVCLKVIEAWRSKIEFAAAREADRVRKATKRAAGRPQGQLFPEEVGGLSGGQYGMSGGNPSENPLIGKGTGTVTGKEGTADPDPAAETWSHYAVGYKARYLCDPVRNAKTNSQVKQFVARLGAKEAPAVAAFFLTRDDAYYLRRGHSLDVMLNDAEKLRMEWITARPQTVVPLRKQSIAESSARDEEVARLMKQQRGQQ